MTTWWKQSGHAGPIVGDTGAPVLCATCPCTTVSTICDCILERQKAANVYYTGWTTCPGTYTLTQLKAYVNGMAPSYIDGTYTGGASLPTMLTNTYANAAATEAELLVLVKDMLTTKTAYGTMTSPNNYAGGVGNRATEALAKADAIAAYAYTTGVTYWAAKLANWKFDGTDYDAQLNTWRAYVSRNNVYDGIASDVRFFGQSDPGLLTFDKQGFSIPDAYEYGEMATVLGNTSTTVVSGYVVDAAYPPNWAPTALAYGFGFYLIPQFILFDWDFACV